MMLTRPRKTLNHFILSLAVLITAHASFSMEVPKESDPFFQKAGAKEEERSVSLAEIEKKELEVKGLVESFAGFTGCCPNLGAGTLCAMICCPCCIPCIAVGAVCEIFSLPSTRVKSTKQNVRRQLLTLKNYIRSAETPNARKEREYDEYILSISETTSNSCRKIPLFDNPHDLNTFLIAPTAGSLPAPPAYTNPAPKQGEIDV